MDKLFVNSLPKSGTNLLQKLVELMGYEYGNLGIAPTLVVGRFRLLRQILRGALFSNNPVIVGLDLPASISPRWLKKRLHQVKKGEYVSGHANYSDHLAYLLRRSDFKTIIIIRDPRDVLVSLVHYISKTRSHFCYNHYQGLSMSERIEFAIKGGATGELYTESFATMLSGVTGWFKASDVMVVKFEELVGSAGGGSRELQLQRIEDIADFLGLAIDSAKINQVADNLYGGTHTFRKGKIGSWREELTAEQVSLLRESIGEIVEKWGYNW